MVIPKKIHYVWVGGNDKPSDVKRCMKTWKKYLKDYEIIEWNETNFDINSHPFVKKAYKSKKWAFVSDYIRMWAVYNQGGVYLDTDNLVVANIDDLLNNRCFVGFENENYPFTACFGAEKNHPFIKKVLDSYNGLDINFDFNDNNTISVSNLLINNYKCEINNREQLLGDGVRVYPDYILCNPSSQSKVIHVFTGTWLEGKKTCLRKINKFLKISIDNQFKAKLFRKIIMKK